MEEFINMIANVGFPIAVAAYLLIRVEGKLGQLTSAINELREAIIMLPRVNVCHSDSDVRSYGDNGKAKSLPGVDYEYPRL